MQEYGQLWLDNMNIVRQRCLLAALAMSLVGLSITSCGKKGDLFLPDAPAQVKSSPSTQESPNQDAQNKEDEKKKQEDQIGD